MSDQWASYTYLNEFVAAGIDVVYLNVDQVILRQNPEIINESETIRHVVISSLREFEGWVEREKDAAVFIPYLTIVPQVWPLFKVLGSHGAMVAYLHVGELPNFANDFSRVNLMRKLKKLLAPRKIIERILFEYRKKKMSAGLDYIFVAGSAAKEIHRKYGARRIIDINYRDYEDAVSQLEEKGQCDVGDYLLFLDIYLPFHQDNPQINLIIDPEKYFRSLNRFFAFMEGRYGAEVVVAAHPKSRYDLMEDKFNGRRVVKGKTAELVYGSRFVINQGSASLNYAIIYNKKMFFVTTDNIMKLDNIYPGYLKGLAKLLDCPLINIDDQGEILSMDFDNIAVNQDKRNDYKYKYLTSKQSEGRRSWNIVFDELFRGSGDVTA